MPLLSTFGAASARGFGNLSGIALPSDDLWNTVSFLSHFDGANNGVNNAFDDGSASNHTITAAGNVTQGSFGPFARPDGEWGVNFDGDDGIKTPASGVVDFGTGDFTIEAFFNSNVVDSSNDTIIQNWGGGTGNPVGFAVNRGSSGGIQFYIGSSLILDTGANAFVANTWNHLAVARSGTSLKMFVNGSVVVTATNSGNITVGNSNVSVGYDVQGTNNYFSGSISNVRIVKGTAVYTSAFTPTTAPLTAITNTQLLTCQSNRFVDNSASARTLTLAGNPSASAFGPFLTTSAYDPAVNGASLYAPTYADYLRIPNSAEFELDGDFSVEFWANLDEAFNNQLSIFMWANNDSQTQIGQEDSRDLYFYRGSNIIQNTNVITQTKAWNHVALCRSGSVLSMYCNGVRIGTASYTSTVDFSDGYVAAYDPAQGQYAANGYMSDLRILKGSSAYDASQTTLTVPTAPLTAITNTKLLLNMADGQAIDSAAQNNMTLLGNTKLSTTQAKFGDTSMLFATSEADKLDLGDVFWTNSDWTHEFWIYLNSNSTANRIIFTQYTGQVVDGRCVIQYINSTGKIMWFIGISGANVILDVTMSKGAWHHVALTRSGNDYKLFLDGTAGATGSSSQALESSVNTIMGPSGFSTQGQGIDGFIDDLRFSKFVRYTNNFTAPTAPFPDKGQ